VLYIQKCQYAPSSQIIDEFIFKQLSNTKKQLGETQCFTSVSVQLTVISRQLTVINRRVIVDLNDWSWFRSLTFQRPSETVHWDYNVKQLYMVWFHHALLLQEAGYGIRQVADSLLLLRETGRRMTFYRQTNLYIQRTNRRVKCIQSTITIDVHKLHNRLSL